MAIRIEVLTVFLWRYAYVNTHHSTNLVRMVVPATAAAPAARTTHPSYRCLSSYARVSIMLRGCAVLSDRMAMRYAVLRSRIALRTYYAVRGTALARESSSSTDLSRSTLPIVLRAPYAMSGTEFAYAATRHMGGHVTSEGGHVGLLQRSPG
eukprot:3311051-Rhodomonas_salina.1